MAWWSRIKWWIERKKSQLPGWVQLLLGILLFIPDMFDAVKFWIEIAKATGGVIGWAATILDSPWFALILIVVGFVWIHFADEPRWRVRHPILSYIGWTFVAAVSLAFWSVLVAGYAANRVGRDLQQKVETLEKQLAPWELTENQKRQLVAALEKSKVPPGTTYQLRIIIPEKCEKCAGYATDLAETWHKIPGWEVRSLGNYGLDIRLQGVFVAVDMEGCPSEELYLVMTALDAAEITYEKIKTEGNTGAGSCVVVVGNRPREKAS